MPQYETLSHAASMLGISLRRCLTGEARSRMTRYLKSHYNMEWDGVVPGVTNVYYTWFGPPAAPKEHPTKGYIRPDIWAPIQLASAQFRNDPAPRVNFCCMAAHADAFRNALPDSIEVIPVEERLQDEGVLPVSMRWPPLDNLRRCVRFIVDQGLRLYQNRLDVRKLVNAKNIWSMWCMYEYGGYHLDTGVYPGNGDVDLPAPKTFGVPCITPDHGTYGGARHISVSGAGFRNRTCSTLIDDGNIFAGAVFRDAPRIEGGQSKLTKNFDVWLLRSPPKHQAAQRALEWYIQTWCRMESMAGQGGLLAGAELYKAASRAAVMSAVATGITHSGHGTGCSGMALWKSHLLQTEGQTFVRELNLHKLGFRSHG